MWSLPMLSSTHADRTPVRCDAPWTTLKGHQWRREELVELDEWVCWVTPHGQVGAEVAHGVPQLHLKQREGTLHVSLRIHILPTSRGAIPLVPALVLRLSLHLSLGLGGLGLLLLLPVAVYLLRRWYLAGALRWLACTSLASLLAVALLSALFAAGGWGLHIHHYFTGMIGYLLSRGTSRVAAVMRAVALGAFIHGLCIWGQPLGIPIWSEGTGTYHMFQGEIETSAQSGAGDGAGSVMWTGAQGQQGGDRVALSWALWGDLRRNCSQPLGEPAAGSPVYVVEMNHVEVYRGPHRSISVRLPAAGPGNPAGRFFFRVGVVSKGLLRGVASASNVLAVRAGHPPVDLYYNETSANACERAYYLLNQPASSLAGYV
mmetsp:Transcript_5927/g.18357  ORF Transcript_5927/g.18357 Transcript_5927/m.18357 type:complete len:374 (-) Transcript_5927:51-1172(-)